jgi:hypothetical protein
MCGRVDESKVSVAVPLKTETIRSNPRDFKPFERSGVDLVATGG